MKFIINFFSDYLDSTIKPGVICLVLVIFVLFTDVKVTYDMARAHRDFFNNLATIRLGFLGACLISYIGILGVAIYQLIKGAWERAGMNFLIFIVMTWILHVMFEGIFKGVS